MIQNKTEYIASLLPLTFTAEGMENYTFQEKQTFLSAWAFVLSSDNLDLVRRVHSETGINAFMVLLLQKGGQFQELHNAPPLSEDAVIKNLHHMLSQQAEVKELEEIIEKAFLKTSETT